MRRAAAASPKPSSVPRVPRVPGDALRPFPPLAALLDWREPYLLPLALLVLSRGILGAMLPLASEDAYITYRYARNFAMGLGPVFNPGERVMGFTSPLWMSWNALGWLLTHDPVLWSRLWTIVGDAVTLVTAAWLLTRHVSRTSAWCFAFAFAVWIAFTGVAISGMENNMMITLIMLSATLIESRSRAAGVALGALALLRPEGVVAAAVLALRARGRDRLGALALAGAGFGLVALYFGSPIPQSLVAKAQVYGTPGPWAGRAWWEWAFPFVLGRWPSTVDGSFVFLGTVLAAPAAFSGFGVLWRLRRTALAHAGAACLLIWLAYSLTGIAYFFWYHTVPLAGWFLLVAIGLPGIVRGKAIYVSAALLMLGCWSMVWQLYGGRARAEASLQDVASYLEQHASPGQKVMLEPIGIVGYQTHLVVLDEVGLVSPRIAARRLQGPGWMNDVVTAEDPEWLVIRRGVLQSGEAFAGAGAPFRSATERDGMLARYGMATVQNDAAGEAALAVLRRRQ